MKNERGLTLVEILGGLTILGLIAVIVGGVLINGISSSKGISDKQLLQQEANVITEIVRKEYLRKYDENLKDIKIEIDDQALVMDGKVISAGYDYELKDLKQELIIPRDESSVTFSFTIKKNKQSHKVETRFSKLK